MSNQRFSPEFKDEAVRQIVDRERQFPPNAAGWAAQPARDRSDNDSVECPVISGALTVIGEMCSYTFSLSGR